VTCCCGLSTEATDFVSASVHSKNSGYGWPPATPLLERIALIDASTTGGIRTLGSMFAITGIYRPLAPSPFYPIKTSGDDINLFNDSKYVSQINEKIKEPLWTSSSLWSSGRTVPVILSLVTSWGMWASRSGRFIHVDRTSILILEEWIERLYSLVHFSTHTSFPGKLWWKQVGRTPRDVWLVWADCNSLVRSGHMAQSRNHESRWV
jgi:hypothetical protein